jgi:hypothetical protein
VGNGTGASVGNGVGRGAGSSEGAAEGVGVGSGDGASVGRLEGSRVGAIVGGVKVGAGEGAQLEATTKFFSACKEMLVLLSSAFRMAANSEVVGSPQADTPICGGSYCIRVNKMPTRKGCT